MNKKLFVSIIVVIAIAIGLSAQEAAKQPPANEGAAGRDFAQIVDDYINAALVSNLDISVLAASAEQTNAERKEALSAFFPNVTFQSRYTASGGGRKIVIDINKFVGALFPGMSFPVIEEAFLRPHEQETKFNATQVLFAGGAVLNAYNGKSSLYDASLCKLESAKWNKRLEIAEAYLGYLKASELVKIKERVLQLAKDGLSLTESLFRQDKLLKSDVMRSNVNVSKAESDLAEANEQKRLAQRFFNNLLNRNPFEAIEESPVTYEYAVKLDTYDIGNTQDKMQEVNDFESQALKRRMEIKSLDHSLDAMSNFKNVAFSEYLPKIVLSADYGWQGEEYLFNSDTDFYSVSLVFQFSLFDGFGREARMQKAVYQEKELEIQKLIAMKNIGLQVEQAYLKLQTSRKQIKAAEEQLASAEENFRIVQKRFSLGMALSIDMNDALAELDIAGSTRVIALYDYIASIERMTNALGSEKGDL